MPIKTEITDLMIGGDGHVYELNPIRDTNEELEEYPWVRRAGEESPREDGYGGKYPRYRYEMIDVITGALVESATKKHKMESKTRDRLEGQKAAWIVGLRYFQLEQNYPEGPWEYHLLAEGREIIRHVDYSHKPGAATKHNSTTKYTEWNNVTQRWEIKKNASIEEELDNYYKNWGYHGW